MKDVNDLSLDQLISAGHREQNFTMHQSEKGYGGSSWRHAWRVSKLYDAYKCNSMLDYGCGARTLKKELHKVGRTDMLIREYDPAIPKLSALPSPADLVVCTDVLEHIEPDKIDSVIRHLFDLTQRVAFLTIATRPANKEMPDGRNAHLIIEQAGWWMPKIESHAWKLAEFEDKRKGNGEPHDLRMVLVRQ